MSDKIYVTEELRAKIIYYRKKKGFGQDKVADLMNMPRTTYWYKEKNAAYLSSDFIGKLAKVLEVSPNVFLTEQTPPQLTMDNHSSSYSDNFKPTPKEQRALKMLRMLPEEAFVRYYNEIRKEFEETIKEDD